VASISDDFNRANSTDLGAGWVEVSGDWSIVSNQLSPGAAGGTIILRAATAMASNDHYAQVTIAATTAASQGVWCRGNSNISQGYLWRNNGSSWDLFSVVGGSFTVIATYAVAAVAGDVAKVQAVGSTIKGYVNGVERASVVNTAVATGTSVGIRSDSAGAIRYDDFSAADITVGATLGIASASESAQALIGSKAAALGISGASETAQPVTGTKTVPLETAGTSETAQQIGGAKTGLLGTAAATESAQPISGSKSAALSPAGTSETAQPLTGSKTAVLGPALEAATAQALTGAKTAPLPAAGESDTAQPLAVGAGQTLGVAGAAETAMPLTGTKTATLGIALESDTARPLTVPSATVSSPERTYKIPAEHRYFAVPAEHRTLTVRR
jgi:hypothetical protein